MSVGRKIKTRSAERDELLKAFANFADFAIREKKVDFAKAIQLEAAQLSLYDASYLWLAGDMGIGLVTLDRRLAEAATSI